MRKLSFNEVINLKKSDHFYIETCDNTFSEYKLLEIINTNTSLDSGFILKCVKINEFNEEPILYGKFTKAIYKEYPIFGLNYYKEE